MTDHETPQRKSKRVTSAIVAVAAVLVLGGATTALFTLEACAEGTPAQPTSAPPPGTSTASAPSSTAKPPTPPPTGPQNPPPPT